MASCSLLLEAFRFYSQSQSQSQRNLVVIHGRVASGMLVRLTSVHGELGIRKGAAPRSQGVGSGQAADTMDK